MISEVRPQSELDWSAKQLGDLLVVTESNHTPQPIGQLGSTLSVT